MSEFFSLLNDANTQWVIMSTFLLGLSSGVLGSFALLRKQSLIGDAMAHAALPGICVMFLLIGSKSIGLFMVGAVISGLLASFCIYYITNNSRIKEETAIGLILSVFFGFGIVLLTYIQHNANANQSGLDDFLFGQAASLVGEDVKVMAIVSTILLVITALLFKEFKLLSFDPEFGKGIGLPAGFLNFLLMVLIVGAVVIGLQAVGIILMAAMLITPAIAARFWVEKLSSMVIVAGLFGGISGIFGTLISTLAFSMPTGPLIVIAATILFIISMLFAPKRGLLMKSYHHLRLKKKLQRQKIILSLYSELETLYKNRFNKQLLEGIAIEKICSRSGFSERLAVSTLQKLQKEKLVSHPEGNWSLTELGLNYAYEGTLDQRLWELYLMYEMKYASTKGEYTSIQFSKQMNKQTVTELTELLHSHGLNPELTKESYNTVKNAVLSKRKALNAKGAISHE
jgi:manganese/zinc/iron transport system permease protein